MSPQIYESCSITGREAGTPGWKRFWLQEGRSGTESGSFMLSEREVRTRFIGSLWMAGKEDRSFLWRSERAIPMTPKGV